MYTTDHLSPLDLHLDEKNPRFRIDLNPSQNEIREYMLKHENLFVLANSMVNMNTLLPGERVIISQENGKNIVLEGNRRTCIYQMLLNRSLIPESAKRVFPEAKSEFLNEIQSIPVDIVPNKKDAMAFLAARHIIGVEKWSSYSKWKISFEYFVEGLSINEISTKLVMSANTVTTSIRNYKILQRGIVNPIWNEQERKSLNLLDIKPDKLIRIFHQAETVKLFGLKYLPSNDLCSDLFSDELITKLILLLTKMAFISGELDTRTTISDVREKIISEIPEYSSISNQKASSNSDSDKSQNNEKNSSDNNNPNSSKDTETSDNSTEKTDTTKGTGGKKNLPYFFEGLQYGHLQPIDPETHGVTRICNEIQNFSNHHFVESFPICSAFLVRALIEHSIKYYSKTNNIQGQEKLIWSQIIQGNPNPKLSQIIDQFNRNLINFIPDKKANGYFASLFSKYNETADPLNWVIHNPEEFVIAPERLRSLASQGLLSLINFFIK
ncbi:hypothetical protein SDC9_55823 [bioreactor metagenome]|uniref:ParB/Sulfiredoxin domain-containing protein n=1 Tax=bioreactor metagenome TaxID=1076179 RepID=A0A644X5R6_9ZZZZ